MSSLGKIVNSFFNATNENTIALANLNFDFSIVKYEAPKEFQEIGSNLSSRRRDEAEDGKTHRIASRLGALFRSIVPATPHLITAYGSRASQIASSPDTNPAKNPNYGPFADYVGIDGTSLWAAATSAKPNSAAHAPLAMHLLACILARRWEPSVAVSVWAEIVNQRQHELESSIQNEPQDISLYMAAKHEISRDDLACWDTSARAWLQSADQSRSKERIQFDLIARNISIEIGSGAPTYQNVIEVWRCAMQGMDCLIQGIPQEVSDGAVLVALSAWHLYPDLIILGEKMQRVSFQDPLVAVGGIVTVGLQYAEGIREPGMHWSLTLSLLRYYEPEVKVQASTDTSRVSMQDLLVVAFGSLMASWRIPRQDEKTAAQILVKLRNVLRPKNSAATLESQTSPDHHLYAAMGSNDFDPSWLRTVVLISKEFLGRRSEDSVLCDQLTAWGRRRAANFLASADSLPLFGISNRHRLTALTSTNEHEATILYLREIAKCISPKWRNRTFLIRCRDKRANPTYVEIASVTPHIKRSSKRELDGSLRSEERHFRWCCIPRGKIRQGTSPADTNRIGDIQQLGEDGYWICDDSIQGLDSNAMLWHNAPPVLHVNLSTLTPRFKECPSMRNGFERCSCTEAMIGTQAEQNKRDLRFEVAYGDPGSCCLLVSLDHSPSIAQDIQRSLRSETGGRGTRSADLRVTLSFLQKRVVNSWTLSSYLQCYDGTIEEYSYKTGMREHMLLFLQRHEKMTSEQRRALHWLGIGQQVYKTLAGATIPLAIVANSLDNMNWVSTSPRYADKSTRADTDALSDDALVTPETTKDYDEIRGLTALHFACIIYFDSGAYNIPASECNEVIAVASGNSIFVDSHLIFDPCRNETTTARVSRIAGNVGMPGISMLITPQQIPRTRPLGNNFRVVPHVEFNGGIENNFQPTTLHLRFTKWRRPYNIESRGNIDEGLFFVESVVSVHDSGKWVSDLDVRLIREYARDCLWSPRCICEGEVKGDFVGATSIDTWEELLDPPERLGIMRAQGNWSARLAAMVIRCQKDLEDDTAVLSSGANICRKCVGSVWLAEFDSDTGVIII